MTAAAVANLLGQAAAFIMAAAALYRALTHTHGPDGPGGPDGPDGPDGQHQGQAAAVRGGPPQQPPPAAGDSGPA